MTFEQDLLSLRAGALGFAVFERRYRERFRRWAGYFFERWPQSQLDIDDLVQEGLIEAWRAVDRWDEAAGPTIARFVEYRVGSCMRGQLRKACGNPDKRRGFKPIRNVTLALAPVQAVDAPQEVTDDIDAILGDLDGLEREVVSGVLRGANHAVVAAHLFQDQDRREAYGFRDQGQAVKSVRSTIRKVTKRFPGKPRSLAR